MVFEPAMYRQASLEQRGAIITAIDGKLAEAAAKGLPLPLIIYANEISKPGQRHMVKEILDSYRAVGWTVTYRCAQDQRDEDSITFDWVTTK